MKPFNYVHSNLILLLLGVFFFSGCAHNRQIIAELEKENAQQRERIWQSNRRMEDFRQENESLRQQLAALQGRKSVPGSSSAPSQGFVPSAASGNASVNHSIIQAVPGNSLSNAPSQTQPSTSGSTFNSSPVVTPQPPASSLGPSSPLHVQPNPPSGSQAMVGSAPRKTIHVRKTDSQNVHTVTLLPEKTRLVEQNGVMAGIHVEFQLKDVHGNILLAPAPLVAMVTDPSLQGEQAKISKWNYSAEEIAEIINSNQAGISIPLNMGWERGCPKNLNLELHIVYQTSDQRMLVHRAPVNLSNTSGLVLGAVNPAVGANAGAQMGKSAGTSGTQNSDGKLERPEWGPNP